MEVSLRPLAIAAAAAMAAMMCYCVDPVTGRSVILSPDAVYFPDQVEYLRASFGKCDDEDVYWPSDGQCYVEGEQGPCPFGHLLRSEKTRLRPQCAPDPSVRVGNRGVIPEEPLRDAISLLSFRPFDDTPARPPAASKNDDNRHGDLKEPTCGQEADLEEPAWQ